MPEKFFSKRLYFSVKSSDIQNEKKSEGTHAQSRHVNRKITNGKELSKLETDHAKKGLLLNKFNDRGNRLSHWEQKEKWGSTF